jgi:hypothetical protein
MSAFPLIATEWRTSRHVSKVPEAVIRFVINRKVANARGLIVALLVQADEVIE